MEMINISRNKQEIFLVENEMFVKTWETFDRNLTSIIHINKFCGELININYHVKTSKKKKVIPEILFFCISFFIKFKSNFFFSV